jgi:hypothetical protein
MSTMAVGRPEGATTAAFAQDPTVVRSRPAPAHFRSQPVFHRTHQDDAP